MTLNCESGRGRGVLVRPVPGLFCGLSGRRGRNGYQKVAGTDGPRFGPRVVAVLTGRPGPPLHGGRSTLLERELKLLHPLRLCVRGLMRPWANADERLCANALVRLCGCASGLGEVLLVVSLPLILGPPIALGCRRWGAGSCGRLSTPRLWSRLRLGRLPRLQ